MAGGAKLEGAAAGIGIGGACRCGRGGQQAQRKKEAGQVHRRHAKARDIPPRL
jgi:hypothetical protein